MITDVAHVPGEISIRLTPRSMHLLQLV